MVPFRRRGSWERSVLVLAAVIVAWSAVTGWPQVGDALRNHPRLIAAYLAALAFGELGRVRLPTGRVTAPVATASAMALAFTAQLHGEPAFKAGASVVVLIAASGSGLGILVRRARHREVGLYLMASRLVGTAAVAALTRTVELRGSTLWRWEVAPSSSIPVAAAVMVAISSVGVLTELVLAGLVRSQRHHTQWGTALRDDLSAAQALTVSLIAAGPLVALLAPVLGLAALPLALFPMILTYVAVDRYAANQLTYRQMIATLSRLTEAGGYTPKAHAERVAELSVAIGRSLGLLQRELRDLEYAALLHDLGQIALREPIPGGATVLAAPDDQRRIAADGARIVRRATVLDAVAALIEIQATPYRQVRELGEEVPLASRIIKVANAFDDLSGDDETPAVQDRAMERIHLGLGYEYDPLVVDALAEVLRTRASVWRDPDPRPRGSGRSAGGGSGR